MMPEPVRIDTLAVTVAPPQPVPFDIDAVVEEQDTALVLDIEPIIREPQEDYAELVDGMIEQQPCLPGDIIVRKGRPQRFLAIVHDLDREPSCEAGGIAVALENLLRQFNQRRIRAAAMPLLGTVHGRFPDETFLALLYNALRSEPPEFTERLWLIAPEADCERIARNLRLRARDTD